MKRSVSVLLALLVALAARPACAEPGPPLAERHQRWLETDVDLIISDRERDAFLALGDAAARDAFMRSFWEARDPTPGTAANEYAIVYRERVAAADKLFRPGGHKLGSRSPRGRLYVQLGPPQDRTLHTFEARLHPLELWLYHGDRENGLPAYFFLIFYKPYGVGDYELYDPGVDGPEKLVGGYLQTGGVVRRSIGAELSDRDVAPLAASDAFGRPSPFGQDRMFALKELAKVSTTLEHTSLSLIPSEPADVDSGEVRFASRRLIARLEDLPSYLPFDDSYLEPPGTELPQVTTSLNVAELEPSGRFQPAFAGPHGGAVHYAIELGPSAVTLFRAGDHASGALEVSGRAFDRASGEPVAEIERRYELTLTNAELERLAHHPLALSGTLPLVPGAYRVKLVVRDVAAGGLGAVEAEVDVPEAPREGVALGPILFAAEAGASEGAGGYTFGGRRWYPLPEAAVGSGGELVAIAQVACAGGCAAAGPLKARFVLRSQAASPPSERSITSPVALDADGWLGVAILREPLAGLAPGSYSLEASLGGPAGPSASSATVFTLAAAPAWSPPWIAPFSDGRSSEAIELELAEQHLSRGAEPRALEALEVAAGGQDVAARALLRLAELRLRRGEFAAARQAAEELAAGPQPATRAFLLLGLARSSLGEADAAIDAYQRGLGQSPDDVRLLNLLGEERLNAGQARAAAESFERSLALKPEQLGIRERLRVAQTAAAR